MLALELPQHRAKLVVRGRLGFSGYGCHNQDSPNQFVAESVVVFRDLIEFLGGHEHARGFRAKDWGSTPASMGSGLMAIAQRGNLKVPRPLVSVAISNARNWPSPLKAVVTAIDSAHKGGSFQMLVLPWYFAAGRLGCTAARQTEAEHAAGISGITCVRKH